MKAAQKKLTELIRVSKKKHWRILIENLEQDIFGDGYKIVVKDTKGLVPGLNLAPETVRDILNSLFPIQCHVRSGTVAEDKYEEFSQEELQTAVEQSVEIAPY